MAGKTKSRSPLTKDRVLKAALRLADEGGIESLSMRKLGQELGVEAMSLYNHVANKDEVLDGIVEAVVREVELPPGGDRLEGGSATERDLGPRNADAALRGRRASGGGGRRAPTACGGPSSCFARSARPASPRT